MKSIQQLLMPVRKEARKQIRSEISGGRQMLWVHLEPAGIGNVAKTYTIQRPASKQ